MFQISDSQEQTPQVWWGKKAQGNQSRNVEANRGHRQSSMNVQVSQNDQGLNTSSNKRSREVHES